MGRKCYGRIAPSGTELPTGASSEELLTEMCQNDPGGLHLWDSIDSKAASDKLVSCTEFNTDFLHLGNTDLDETSEEFVNDVEPHMMSKFSVEKGTLGNDTQENDDVDDDETSCIEVRQEKVDYDDAASSVQHNEEGVTDLVNEYLTEIGQDILKLTIKEITVNIQSALGIDLQDWKDLVKHLAKARATEMVEKCVPTASSKVVEPIGKKLTRSALSDDGDFDSEYEASEASDVETAPPKTKHLASKSSKLNKVVKEELEGLAEDDEALKRNQALMSLMNGDADQRSKQTKERRAQLIERIAARNAPKNSQYYEFAEKQLLSLKTPGPKSSPDGDSEVVGIEVRASHTDLSKASVKWGGNTSTPVKDPRAALKSDLKKRVYQKAGDVYTKEFRNSSESHEQYLSKLKMVELKRRILTKRQNDSQAQQQRAIDQESVDKDTFSDDDDAAEAPLTSIPDAFSVAGSTAEINFEVSGDFEDSGSGKTKVALMDEAGDGVSDNGRIVAKPLEIERPIDEINDISAVLTCVPTSPSRKYAFAQELSPTASPIKINFKEDAPLAAHARSSNVELNGALKHRLHASGSLSVVPKQRSIASFYRGGEKNSGSEPIQELESTKPSEVGEATTMQVPHVDSATQSTKMDDEAINSETVDKEDDVDDGDEDEGESEPRDRNAMYKALISQDSKKEKLRRKAKRHGFIDDEAEESEDEDQIAGLGDFGFTRTTDNKSRDDDERVEVQEDDFDNIVDELSDGEGDESGLTTARILENKEEDKIARAEMKRRVKEGFDGRRGGGVVGARGQFRTEQLVALDKEQKKEARRLGLATSDDDESENEDDKAAESDVDSNEELDMAIKERYRRVAPQDSSSSEEEEEDDTQMPKENNGSHSDEDDEREEKRKAKIWEKSIKMRRELGRSTENEDSRSRSRFLDDDEESQSMLSMLKRTKSNASSTKLKMPKLTRQASFGSESRDDVRGVSRSATVPGIGNDLATLETRKGSFVAMRRATTLPAGAKTVSNNRYVFHAGTNDENSQSASSSAWSDHVKRTTGVAAGEGELGGQAPSTSAAKRPHDPSTLPTSVWTAMAVNRFKRGQKS